MKHVIYNIATSKIWEVCRPGRTYGTRSYVTQGAAKAALTREVNKGRIARDEYAVTDIENYRKNIEVMETVSFINPHSGEKCEVTQSVNTPRSCDPSSELYWSM